MQTYADKKEWEILQTKDKKYLGDDPYLLYLTTRRLEVELFEKERQIESILSPLIQ